MPFTIGEDQVELRLPRAPGKKNKKKIKKQIEIFGVSEYGKTTLSKEKN